ncbi:hypothetical protein D915_002312 [Fasciola hepatica]|uniref:KATNIP domain-containing protein n=1 Tax=Fasciola hepatica TaxID=6192 RepID=A0A4E0RGV1_FASHE|nr:hypothetical protein D915_002312 [Fasciola hepatica]
MQRPVKIVAEQVNHDYQDYLLYLEEKNRQRAQLRRKSREDHRREKLEQGFSLFFNLPSPDIHRRRAKSRGPRQSERWTDESTCSSDELGKSITERTRSAPGSKQSEGRRRVWGPVAIPRSITNGETIHDVSRIRNQVIRANSNNTMHLVRENERQLERTDRDNTNDRSLEQGNKACSQKSNFVSLGVEIDVLSNWGHPKSVGLRGVSLLSEDDDRECCSVSELKILILDSNGEVTDDYSQKDSFREAQHLISNLLRRQPWEVNASIMPFRILVTFECRPSNDRFHFRVLNLSHGQKSRTASLNHIRLRFVFPSKNTKQIEANIQPENAFDLQIDLAEEKIQFRKTENKIAISAVTELELDHDDSIHKTCCTSWLDDQQKEERISKASGLLDHVSPEMLYMPSTVFQQRWGCHSRRRVDSLLECSWSSLDFFNHFHAGRLCDDSMTYRFTTGIPKWPDTKTDLTEIPEKVIDCDVPVCEPNEKEKKHTGFVLQPRPSTLAIPVPELPQGSTLTFDIVNTWGDIYYVGLSGVEIFTVDGINIAPLCEISADPPDINILPGYGTDPRVVSNLTDGVNWTRDDTHMWLAPFNPGERHLIFLRLPRQASKIAMIRIWNYNKSRVHTSRGVKELIIYLDDKVIFYGEIKRALGMESEDPTDFCETILFTTDDNILEVVAKNDQIIHMYCSTQETTGYLENFPEKGERSITHMQKGESSVNDYGVENVANATFMNQAHSEVAKIRQRTGFIEIELLESWNTIENRIGLTGMKLVDQTNSEIQIEQITVTGVCEDESGPLDVLLNGNNETTDLAQMWSCLLDKDFPPCIRLFYQNRFTVDKLQLWNHNGITNVTNYGVKKIRILSNCDERLCISAPDKSILIRRAPGHTKFPLVQNIPIKTAKDPVDDCQLIERPDTASLLPYGFVYRVDIFSTWSDRYYVGLDGLELLDHNTKPIPIQPQSIFAFPSCVNDMSRAATAKHIDIRTVDKLVDGVTSGSRINSHCWLAPIDASQGNQIFIVFDEPVTASGLRLWNYSRTVERGVREFAVFVDDQIIFHGYLPKAIPVDRKISDNACEKDVAPRKQTILPMTDNWQLDANGSQPHVIVFDSRYAPRFAEYPRYIIHGENVPCVTSSAFTIDLTKTISVHKPKLFTRTQRDPVNPELRPFTCVAHCRQ